MKIGAIIQARVGSTRLPGKVLKDLKGKKVLEHVVERVQKSKIIDNVIIASTVSPGDDAIEALAMQNHWDYYRGSENDVLSRYYEAATKYNLDVIIRITSDCPLIDPQIIDEMLRVYISGNYEFVANVSADISKRTFPRGLDIEIFSYDMLRKAFINAKEKYQREHVTPYLYENISSIFYYRNNIDLSNYRWTLDTDEDWRLISEIYRYLYKGSHDFFFEDILAVMEDHPELAMINARVEQKKLKE